MLNLDNWCVLCDSCFCRVIGRTLTCDITEREFWADTLLCQNQMFLENPDWLLVWYYHFFLIINTHLEYLVVKDSRQLVDDSKQAVQLRIRLICCWTPYCPGCQEKTVLVSSHGEGDCCNERNTVLRADDRILSLSLGRNCWMESNVQISFHFFVLVYSSVADAKLCRVQSGVCACGLFSSLSGLDWGTQLTRGCTHRPPDGGVDPGGGRRVGGQRGLLLVRDASQKQSADALLYRSWLWIKKTAPLPRSILLSWDGGIRLGLFSSYLSESKAIQQMVNIWSVEENMKIHLERIKTNGVTG